MSAFKHPGNNRMKTGLFFGVILLLLIGVGIFAFLQKERMPADIPQSTSSSSAEEEQVLPNGSFPDTFTRPSTTMPSSGNMLVISPPTTPPDSSGDSNSSLPAMPSIRTYDYLQYTLSRVWVSKDLGPYPLTNFQNFWEEMDDTGHLLSLHSLVFLSIAIENQNDYEVDYRLNSCRLKTIDEDDKRIEESELRFCDQGDGDRNPDFYLHSLAPHETREFILGYVFQDKNLQDANLLFEINNSGSSHSTTSKYIKIMMS